MKVQLGIIPHYLTVLTCTICLILLAASSLHATAITTFDSAGEPSYLEQELEKDPEKYIQVMEDALRQGRLAKIGTLGKHLTRLKKEDPRVSALYSICMASKGELDDAKHYRNQALDQEEGDTLYSLTAQAMILRLEKKHSQAKKVCNKAISMDASHPYPWNVLGRIQFDLEATPKAYESFQKAVNLEKNFLPGHINLGAAAYTLGKDEASIQHFKRALKIAPRASKAHYGLGLVYIKTQRYALAADQFEKTLEIDPENTNALQELGPAQLQAKQYNKALKTGRKMAEHNLPESGMVSAKAALHLGNPQKAVNILQNDSHKDPDVVSLLGYCYMVQNRFNKSLSLMENVLSDNPEHFNAYLARAGLMFVQDQDLDLEAHLKTGWGEAQDKAVSFSRGCALASRGDWRTATDNWKEAKNLIQGFSLTGLTAEVLAKGTEKAELPHVNLGLILYYRDLHAAALSEFDKALTLNNNSIMANYWASQALLKQGMRLKAIDHLHKALEQAPRFFTAQYTVAELHLMTGKPQKALGHYQKALDIREDPGILIKIGMLHESKEQVEEAATAYQDLINQFPEFYVGYNQLAWLYAKRGIKLDKAMGLAKKANELQPGNASILDTIGWIHFHKNNYDQALVYLEKSLEVNPQNPTVLYHLGMTHHALDNSSQARTYLEKALSISDQFKGADKVKNMLNSRL